MTAALGASLPSGVLELLVLQPTPFCNLDCSYCYLPHRDDRRRMPLDLLSRCCERLQESGLVGDALTVVWHAGEPLVVPPGWYEEAFAIMASGLGRMTRLRHSFQTNGTLVDNRWIQLFRDWGVEIGVSLDGPRSVHDASRVGRRGQGSFDSALRGYVALRNAELPVHVIAVLTAASIREPDALYDFFVALEPDLLAFNVEEIEGPHRHSSLEAPDAEAAFRRFCTRFLDRVVEDGCRLKVREFENATGAILSGRTRGNQQADAFRIVNVAVDGSFSTFSPELLGQAHPRFASFSLGNLATVDWGALPAEPTFRALVEEICRGIRNCRRECPYFTFCGGGAPANKIFETGRLDATATVACRLGIMAMIDTLLERTARVRC